MEYLFAMLMVLIVGVVLYFCGFRNRGSACCGKCGSNSKSNTHHSMMKSCLPGEADSENKNRD